MPEPLKNQLNHELISKLALDIQSVYSPFQADAFLRSTMDAWEELELKDRVYRIAVNMGEYLPGDYGTAISIIDQVVGNYGTWLDGWGWFFPIFVELFGQDEENWDVSMGALARYTPYASSEGAVRPFIIKHEARMMAQMVAWSKHESEHVRRLSCEGCRPALPWAPALNSFKKDPTPILPILEQLKTDPSVWVRKSVANNLNDISKTHPALVAKIAKEWYGSNEHTNWIVKHGCRTLLKKGNREVLAIFGIDNAVSIDVEGFALGARSISIGEDITFSFSISAKEATKVRLEYGIDYVKSGGKRNRKIFQLSEISLKENTKKSYVRKHSFADVSTRKHYPGTHSVTLIVNGAERGTLDFVLEAQGKKSGRDRHLRRKYRNLRKNEHKSGSICYNLKRENSEPMTTQNDNFQKEIIMSTQYTRVTFVITPEMEKRLDCLKKDIYYNRSHSEMLRSLLKAGLDVLQGEMLTPGKFLQSETPA